MRKRIAIWILFLSLGVCAQAQLNNHLKEEFQDAEKHGVRIVEHASEIRGAIHDDKVRTLCMQAWDEQVPPDTYTELLEWIRSGHTVWFYDCRLAPQFGMKSYPLNADQFRAKPEKGVLGGGKRSGLATTVVSYGDHAVQTSVGQVTIFLPEIDNGKDQPKTYGAVEVTGDTVPLLQFALDSPALMALRREGRGLIVYKTLLWNEPLSGDRFQLNLLDYSAGFPVPGPAGEGKVGNPPGPDAEYVTGNPATPLVPGDPSVVAVRPPETANPNTTNTHGKDPAGVWSLELKDGTKLVGDLDAGATLEFETSSESLKLKPDEVSSLEFGNSTKLDKLTTSKGRTQSGIFLSSPLKFRTERGVEEFEKEDLQLLQREAPKEK